jgi:hypothetical protein
VARHIVVLGIAAAGTVVAGIVVVGTAVAGSRRAAVVGYFWLGRHSYLQACMATME